MTELKLGRYYNITRKLLDEKLENDLGSHLAYECHESGTRRSRATYGELADLVHRVAGGLHELGVRPEERVAVLHDDSVEAVASVLGAIRIGAVPVVLNTMLKPDKIEFILNDSRALCLITETEQLDAVEEIAGKTPHLGHIVCRGESAGATSFEELVANASPRLDAFDGFTDDVALWQYTSGTTGEPKGVMHTHRQIAFTATTFFEEILRLNPADRTYCVSKLFFGYGQGNAIWGPLWHGASVILFPGRPTPEAVAKIVTEHRPTVLFAAPTHYTKILHDPALASLDVSSLRLCISAGEALPPTVFEEWLKEYNLEILDGIGSTEAFHVFIANRSGEARPGSSGKPVPGYEARVLSREGEPVAQGEEGVLHIRGGSVAIGYWNNYEKTKSTFLGEWLRTGDVYSVDEDGYYWYSGRADDIFKTGGVWVSPIEVENALRGHAAVQDAGVVPFKNAEGLQKGMAFVQLAEGHEGSDELVVELKTLVKQKLEPYKRPELVRFVKELPRTTTGKIQRNVLKEQAGT